MDLQFERRAWTAIYLALGLVEGGTAAVMVRSLFATQVSKPLVDLVLALVSSAPAWANLASLAYARRAQGRPKIAFLQPLLVAMSLCIGALALVPQSARGLLIFFLLYAAARLLWAGVETVRAVLWSVNYPNRMRARITGRININTSVVLALTGLGLGWLLGHGGAWWRLMVVLGAAGGLLGSVAFSRFRVRREAALLEAERVRVEQGARFGVAGIRELMNRDPVFREYQLAMAMFGAGMLTLTPLMVVCQNEVLGLPALVQVLVTTAVPVLVVPFATRPWASYLDHRRVLAFRAAHGRVAVAAAALLMAAVLTRVPWLLLPGALLMGVSVAAGNLGWSLGHNDFAPRGEETRYMALHVTLTGVRGLVTPPIAIGLYHLFEAWRAGLGALALLLPFALIATGARRFTVMHRAGLLPGT
ncbi:MAG TPA: MFS transporter [Steroidobacteraceae bacterium]|nr:MFS transporter [Steroidobacteraceae bacterium]